MKESSFYLSETKLINIARKSKLICCYFIDKSEEYVKKCLKSDLPIIIKEILYYLGLEPNHQGLQQQVAYVLKSQNLMKVRRRINSKLTSVWIEWDKQNRVILWFEKFNQVS